MRKLKGSEALSYLEKGYCLEGINKYKGVLVYKTGDNGLVGINGRDSFTLDFESLYLDNEWVAYKEMNGHEALLYLIQYPNGIIKNKETRQLFTITNTFVQGKWALRQTEVIVKDSSKMEDISIITKEQLERWLQQTYVLEVR